MNNEVKNETMTNHIVKREYKVIQPERILDIEKYGILPIGTDEIFVKLMDCKGFWISNYGRGISLTYGKYNLVNGCGSGRDFRYAVVQNVFENGICEEKRKQIYVAQTVIREFIENPDTVNFKYIWHSMGDTEDYYYRNLYPVSEEQYYAIRRFYRENGYDTEDIIIDIQNDFKYKNDTWRKSDYVPTVSGVGYLGCSDADSLSVSYSRWKNMLNRCYNDNVQNNQPSYKGSYVCKEWLNYSNYRKWFNEHYYQVGDEQSDCDKDILIKGNRCYSPSTVCVVPHSINTLFTYRHRSETELLPGVWYEKDKNKYRAGLAFCGKKIKIGTFDTEEEAFNAYKEYKEKFIKDMAEKYKNKIPYCAYEAMMNWVVDEND